MRAIETHDGVAVGVRGDLLIALWQAPARVHRTRWFFDIVDEAAHQSPNGLMVLLLILDTSSPPDAPARAENAARLRKLGTALRRVVTVPAGDALFGSIVRTVMRAMFLFLGQSGLQLVESSATSGINRILEIGSTSTPSRSQVEHDVKALYAALGVGLPLDLSERQDIAQG